MIGRAFGGRCDDNGCEMRNPSELHFISGCVVMKAEHAAATASGSPFWYLAPALMAFSLLASFPKFAMRSFG
jgi:hypothetical protein